jgi:two-component system chemotaxis response regulator CheB
MIHPPSSGPFIVAVASSAGGLRALTSMLSPLPGNFPASIVVVQHLDPHRPSLLVPILKRRVRLSVQTAEEGERPRAGVVYVAPPDWHVLLNSDSSFRLTQTEPVHFVRPSADVLFASLAAVFQTRVIAVVLTGTGRDGEEGVKAISKAGGTVIAQDEGSSEFFGMPGTAIRTGCVDLVLSLVDIPAALLNLVARGADHEPTS